MARPRPYDGVLMKHPSDVSANQAVVEHVVAPMRIDGVPAQVPKLKPDTVTEVTAFLGALAGCTSLPTGASNENAASIVPTVVVTLKLTWWPYTSPPTAMHCSAVFDVHDAVPHTVPPNREVAVRSVIPKLSPYSDTADAPELGEFGAAKLVGTAESKVKP